MDDLDSILSGQEESAPETQNEELNTQQSNVSEQSEQTQVQPTEPDEDQAQDVNGQKMVPHAALHAQKEKVKRYTEEVADFRKSNEALQRQVNELLQRIPVPKAEQQQPQAKPDWFENPDAAAAYAMQQTVSPQIDQVSQQLMANAKLLAGIKYSDEKVDVAEREFMSAMQSRKLDPADFQKVVNAPNRYVAAVQWHQQKLAKEEIGDDPAAYRAKLEAEILAKHGITPESQTAQETAAQTTPPVMPSNLAGARNVGSRGGPAWTGPPTLEDIFKR